MRILIAIGVAAGLALSLPAGASESTLARIKQSGTIKLGYRENSIPFSFVGDDKQPRGYSVDLCRIVADDLASQLKLPKLDVRWVAVTAQSRFEALKHGQIDLECGNTTQTLSRRAEFDFSVMTFVDGASLLFRKGEKPKSLDDIKGQRVAVVSGTTTEKVLDDMVGMAKLGVILLKVKDHDAALTALKDKAATAYAADRTVLEHEVLDLAGIAAHSSERIAAPIACWLIGRAGLDPEDALNLARDLKPRPERPDR